ncbi:hypothetical protein GCM10010199_01140 [Dactylosporangium roseum]
MRNRQAEEGLAEFHDDAHAPVPNYVVGLLQYVFVRRVASATTRPTCCQVPLYAGPVMSVTTVPCAPARAVRPERCGYVRLMLDRRSGVDDEADVVDLDPVSREQVLPARRNSATISRGSEPASVAARSGRTRRSDR